METFEVIIAKSLQKVSKSIRFFSKLHMVKSPCSNPYKTCCLLRLLRPFLQNVSGKYQKGIMFISKS